MRSPALVIALASLGPTAAGVQDLTLERSRVLTIIGTAASLDEPLFPVLENPGVVFRQLFRRAGATSLRLHFTVVEPDPEGASWGIRLLDAEGEEVWSTWAAELEQAGFWSDEVLGDRATVELISARARSPVRVRVDRVAEGRPQPAPVSTVGANQLSPIGAQEPWVVELGRAVARIRYVGDDDRIYVCSGFLVTGELLLTNQHCLATPAEVDSALVDFDYDRATIGNMRRLRALVAAHFGLDYALARLKRPIDRPALRLGDRRVAAQERLLVIQHPGGQPKQVSIADCQVDRHSAVGRGGGATDFAHLCDTLGGSSGSPVLDFDRRVVVGLHHLGFAAGDTVLVNRAVHLDLVLADIADRHPLLRAEIAAGQPPSPPGF